MFEELDQLLLSDLFDGTQQGEIIELHEGERREVAILFADIKGFTALSERLDPEQVRMILDKLLQLFTLCIKQYGGYVDKYEGDLVMALFGAKVASERDTERAIRAALQMLEKLKQFNALLANNPTVQGVELGIRIGINTGLVTTGRIGEKREGDFTVYGDAVNLASRMESNAPVNRIMLPEEAMQLVKETFEFEDHGEIQVKGKSKPVSVFLVKGLKAKHIHRWEVKQSAYIGREKELAVLHETYDRVKKHLADGKDLSRLEAQKPLVVDIKGQAGLGKSRLMYEFLRDKGEHVWVLHGTTPRFTQNPYCVFASLIRHSLNIAHIDPPPVIKEKLETGFRALEPELYEESEIQNLRSSLPLMGYLLGVKYDDLRLQLTGKELQPHLQTAIRYFLEATAAKANHVGLPLLVILEDLHWLDEASQTTLEFLMNTLNLEARRKQKDFKYLVFFLVYRPEYEVPQAVHNEAEFLEIELQPLDEHDAERLIRSMSAELELPADLKHQLIEKSAGNPFYLEEWVHLISEMPPSRRTTALLSVPKTLTGLILSRIDRLEHDVKLLLQKAAVIGKEFFVEILAEIEKKLQRPENISAQLDHLEARDFVFRTLGSKYSAYLFKHIITQEVAYNTLLIANRKILHRIVAEVIEEQFADNVEEFYYDLAEHYSKAEIQEKAFEYLKKAGEKAQANYDNQKAIALYDQVIALAQTREDRETEIDYLLKKGEIFWLIGKWDEQREINGEAFRLAEKTHDQKRIAEATLALGRSYWLKGEHNNALMYLRQARTGFEIIHDKSGMGRTVNTMGNVYKEPEVGKYTKAIECYLEAINICEKSNEDKKWIPGVQCNMGIAYTDQGEYDKAMACYQTALKMNATLGNDKFLFALTIAVTAYTNCMKGDYDAAMACYEQWITMSQEIGSKWMTSNAFGWLGFMHQLKGNYDTAIVCYDQAIAVAEELQREYHLATWFIRKGETLLLLQKTEEAQAVNAQGLQFAEKVDVRKAYVREEIFRSHVLSAKIDFVLGKKTEAIRRLSDMLTHTQDEAEIAGLHYELWKMTGKENHRQTALERYRTLHKQTPKFEYKKRIEELREPFGKQDKV